MLNRVICGDCTEVLYRLEESCVHMILTDFPADFENTEFTKKTRGKPLNGWRGADRNITKDIYDKYSEIAKAFFRVTKPGASVIVYAGRRYAHRMICAMEDSGFTYKDMICWSRDSVSHRAQRLDVLYTKRGDEGNAKSWEGWRVGNLRPSYESIYWFVKPYRIGGTLADNIIENGVGGYNNTAWEEYSPLAENSIHVDYEKQDKGLHPEQKPINLAKALIELVTLPGQTVLDPFCGSGTTLCAAKKLGRNFIGIDISSEYCNIATNRLDIKQ